MEHKGGVKHVFPGANTSEGYYSCYDYILNQNDIVNTFIIKGGPKVVKSNFIKDIGEELSKRGLNIEFMHNSTDNNSLDGMVVPLIKIALIDGMSPNIIDSKNISCTSEIINLEDFWHGNKINIYQKEIKETNIEINRTFKRAYIYLKAAKLIYNDIRTIYTQAMDFGEVNILTDDLLYKIFSGLNVSNIVGKTRNLLASAITPSGLKNYIDTIIKDIENVFIIKGEPGTGKSTLLSKIIDYAISRGLDVEIFHCAFDPEKIEHVSIPKLSTAVVTSNEYHNVYDNTSREEIVNLNQFVCAAELLKYQSELNYNNKIYNELLNQSINTISNAKRLNDLLETYYISTINTNNLEEKKNEILNKIFEYYYKIK